MPPYLTRTLMDRLAKVQGLLEDDIEWQGRDNAREAFQLVLDDLGDALLKFGGHTLVCGTLQHLGTPCNCGFTELSAYIQDEFQSSGLTVPPTRMTAKPLQAYRKQDLVDVHDIVVYPLNGQAGSMQLNTARGNFRVKINLDTNTLVLEPG
jgi:hypothetical protein